MVECECGPVGNISIPDTVLIDTWWNVNQKTIRRKQTQGNVLIDTWWNVNK